MNRSLSLANSKQALQLGINSATFFLLTLLSPLTSFAIDPNNVDASVLKQSLFTPVATDRSIAYLGQLFGSVGNVLQGSGGQLLSYVFVVFNLAIWVIAGSFVIYTTLTSVLNAAHEGEFMGKKMHSMVPIRVVAGIAALLPKFAGYSFIQLIVMWVVIQGVGLADNVWNSAIDFFQAGGAVYQRTSPGEAAPAFPYKENQYKATLASMQSILNAEICMYTLQNKQRRDLTNPSITPKVPVSQGFYQIPAVLGTPAAQGTPAVSGTDGQLKFGSDTNHTLCGSFTYLPNHEIATNTAVSDLLPIAYYIVNTMVPYVITPQGTDPTLCLKPSDNNYIEKGNVCPQSNDLVKAMANYLSIMSFVKQSAKMTEPNPSATGFEGAKADGWILAGQYYHDMIVANASGAAPILQTTDDFTVVKNDTPPPPTVNAISSDLNTALGGTASLRAGLDMTDTNSSTYNKGYLEQARLIAAFIYAPPPAFQDCTGERKTTCAVRDELGRLALSSLGDATGVNIIDNDVVRLMRVPVSAWYDLLLDSTSPDLQDPIARVRRIGLRMIEGASTFWSEATTDVFAILTGSAFGLTAGLVTAAFVGGAYDAIPPGGSSGANVVAVINTIVQLSFQIIMARVFWYLPLGIALSTPIFVMGAILAVYIPMIPFMLFMFAALGWFITVLEAMVAAPLVALGVTHPEGHDLLGQAQQSVMLLLGVFLKPALLITGLLTGIMLTFISANLLDAGFFPLMLVQIKSPDAVSDTTRFVALVGMLVVYTMAMMAIVDQCFSLIYVLSDKVLRWIGGHPEQSAEGGMMQQVKSGFESKVGEGAQGGGQQVSAVKSSGISTQAAPAHEKKKQKDGEVKEGGDGKNTSTAGNSTSSSGNSGGQESDTKDGGDGKAQPPATNVASSSSSNTGSGGSFSASSSSPKSASKGGGTKPPLPTTQAPTPPSGAKDKKTDGI